MNMYLFIYVYVYVCVCVYFSLCFSPLIIGLESEIQVAKNIPIGHERIRALPGN